MPTGTDFQCRVHPLGTLSPLKYVVICSYCEGQWLLSRHRRRDTWETQGGHIEPGEAPIQAARRELFEESGVLDAALYPVCDYYGWDDHSDANGTVFLAVIHRLGEMPRSEMREARLFQALPENLTYPSATPVLMGEAKKYLLAMDG